jgi:hypothetical protein
MNLMSLRGVNRFASLKKPMDQQVLSLNEIFGPLRLATLLWVMWMMMRSNTAIGRLMRANAKARIRGYRRKLSGRVSLNDGRRTADKVATATPQN